MDRGCHIIVSQNIFIGTVVILVIALGVVGFVAIYTNNQLQNNINSLNSSLNSLQTDYTNLNISYNVLQNSFNILAANMSSLQSQYNSLSNNYASLNTSYVSLNSSYTSLQQNYTSLQTNNTGLQTNYTNLQINYTSLQTNYTNLSSNYSSLNSSYASLQQNYTYLQGNYTALQSIVNFRNSTTFLTNGMLTLPRAGNQNLTYPTPYAGYLSISFVASRGTLIQFSNSNYTGIYAQYPLTGNATSGAFRMPVFPGAETITFQDVPQISENGTSSVVVNITYIF